MAASAAFHFDSQASLLKKSATPAGTVTLTLDSVTGVDSILWTVSLTCENSAGDWTISGSTANNATLTVPNVSGIACIIQCRVNGGTRVDPTTGVQSVGDLVKTAKVYTGAEVIVTGETTESDATYGWAPVVNAALTSGGLSEQTVHTADGALVFGRANILTSVADGMTIPAVATYPGQRMLVINAMAATTAVLTRSGSDVVVNGTSATAYGLPAGESCWITAAATGTNVYIEHGGSGGAASGTEAPTVSTIPQRTSAGVIRSVSYTAETNTDADRYVRGTGADGTTLGALRCEGSSIILGCKTADAKNKLVCGPANDGGTLTLSVSSSAGASNPLSIVGSTVKVCGTSITQCDSANGYAATYTPAAAATLIYANDVTSVTSSIAQAASGAGGTQTIRGGKGAATQAGGTATLAGGDGGSSTAANGRTILGAESHNPGTALAGNVCAILGSPVSNVTARLTCESVPGTTVWQTYQYNSTSIASRAGPGDGSSTSGLKTWDLCADFFNLRSDKLTQVISGTSSYVYGGQKIWLDAPEVTIGDGSTDYVKWLRGSVTISSATTSNLLSYTTTSNRGYRFKATVTAYNATDSQIGSWVVEGACRNIAGTLTQVGATTALGTVFEDAAQTGLDATVDVSGTAIRMRGTNDATDTVRFRGVLELYEVA